MLSLWLGSGHSKKTRFAIKHSPITEYLTLLWLKSKSRAQNSLGQDTIQQLETSSIASQITLMYRNELRKNWSFYD